MDYRQVFQASSSLALLVATDVALTVVDATAAMLLELGRRREDVVGQPFPLVFAANPEHAAALRHVILRRLPQSTSVQRHEAAGDDAPGAVHWWSVTFSPVLSGSTLVCVEAEFRSRERPTEAEHDATSALPPLVLIVEDDSMLNKLIASNLAPYYRIASAFDGLEGLSVATSSVPDLIICDLTLPGIGGEVFVRKARLCGALDRTPILIITGNEDGALRNRLIAAGAQDYLTKPFSMTEMRVRAASLVAPRAARERERELSDELDARKELERSRAEWAAIVAHDLRQPVNAMFVTSAVLAKSYDHGDSEADRVIQRRSIERMLSTARRMSAMVDDLLDVSNIEARCFSIVRSTSTLSHVIDEALEEWPDKIGRVELDIDEQARRSLWIDADRICQVLRNLVSNALKYGDPDSPIGIRAVSSQAHVEVSVTTTGHPLTDVEFRRMFGRYTRSRDSRSAPGLGLGLFICRGIVEAHGGRIWGSSVGKCVTFRFTLPVRRPDSAAVHGGAGATK